jgi:hypothetical protein
MKSDVVPTSESIHIEGNVYGEVIIGNNNSIVKKKIIPQVDVRKPGPQPPGAPREFINRTLELNRLENWIAANETILLYGADGLGKSALLKQAMKNPRRKRTGYLSAKSQKSHIFLLRRRAAGY